MALDNAKNSKRGFWTGKQRSEETKNKIRLSLLGRKLSEETKAKLKGRVPWNKNKRGYHVHSEEFKQNLRESLKGNTYVLGRKQTKEERLKRSLALRREKSYLWRGGLTTLRLQIRNSFQYKEWRRSIFERDNYTCQFCNKHGNKLNADHFPTSFSNILDNFVKEVGIEHVLELIESCKLMWNIDNGRTLCVDCHKLTDNYLVHKKNVR